MQTTIEAQLRQMREALDLGPDRIEISNLLPIFVPASFFALGNFPGPHTRLRAPDIGLTWTVLFPNQTMRYVNFAIERYWEERGLDWKQLALDNLAARTKDHAGVREMRNESGLSAIAFMFEDGLGPSRLLFRGSLSERFPAGYRVAIPEMSCGIAFARDLDGEPLDRIRTMIDHCYRKGTRPLSPIVYDPDGLLPLEDAGL
jgi:hypothetical protein